MDASNVDSRREFLLSAGVFAAGMLAAPGLAQSPQNQNAPSPQPQPQDDQITAPAELPPGVDQTTIAHAERLACIEFSDDERQVMLKTLGDQLAIIDARHRQPYLPNSLAPALTFDPRPPGLVISYQGDPDRFQPSRIPRDTPPDRREMLAFLSVTQLGDLIRRRLITSTKLTQLYLERLKEFDPKLKCVITLTEELALKQAARADAEIAAGQYRGPLHGIPYGAKDLLDTAGIRTTWGAEPFVDRVPTEDAVVVKRLEAAGAVLVAKLSLGALAYNDIWFGGRTNNPWKLDQGSSGSSAGSAAAVAAGLVGFAIGTETYGSIVSPCMRCGATGLRPTFGRVARTGAMALCWSLDKIGPIARTVEDCMLVLNAINGADPGDPSSLNMPLSYDARQSMRNVRVGFNPAWFTEKPANDIDRETLEVVESLGAKLVEIDLPQWSYDTLLNILLAEAAAAFEELTRTNLDDTLTWQEPQAWPNTFRQSWFIPAIEYIQADRFRRQCMNMMAQRMEKVDVILAPSFGASLLLITNNTGHPALTLRTGFKDDGAPHGMTLIGRLFDEGTLCALGRAIEREIEVWDSQPPL
jgi:Asp-tRNA(Asn)/Glu-tRNA(Gln) amidotransferase A subunit family amidase